MTTGSYTRGVINTHSNGQWTYKAGMLSTKTWTGADNPAVVLRNYRLKEAHERLTRAKALRKSGRYAEASVAFGDFSYWRSLAGRRAPRMFEPHPYSMRATRQHFEPGVYRYNLNTCNPNSPWVNLTSNMSAGNSWSISIDPWTSELQNQLLSRLRTRLVGSTFNLPTFLAEGKEGLEMIFHAARTLNRVLLAARRRDFQGVHDVLRTYGLKNKPAEKLASFGHVAKNTAQDAAATYLVWNWGVKPLVQDVVAGAECLAHFTEAPFYHRVKVSVPMRTKASHASPSWGLDGSAKVLARRYLVAYLTEVNTRKLLGLDGWGVSQAAWEVTPYSWLVDYLLPIGSFLEGRGLASALRGTFVTSHLVKQDTVVYGAAPRTQPKCEFSQCSGGFDRKVDVQLDRTVSTTLAVPLPNVVPLGEAASWRRAANILSVVTLNAQRWVDTVGKYRL